MKKEDIVDENEETAEALELETLEVETQLVEAAVKVEAIMVLSPESIAARRREFERQIKRGGK